MKTGDGDGENVIEFNFPEETPALSRLFQVSTKPEQDQFCACHCIVSPAV
jgi:hypothetical protein